MSFAIDSFEKHNILSDNTVRQSFYAQKSIHDGYNYVGGFSVESANTAEVYHYLLERRVSDGEGYLNVWTDNWRLIDTLDIGKIPIQVNLGYAVQNRQLLISAPELPYTIYSILGGGCTRAVTTEVDYTSTIDMPTGLICSFGDRMVIAQGAILYFNDPGVDPRTFAAVNAVALPATVYDIFQGPQGALIIGTADGVYALSADAVGQGQRVFGLLQKISNYQCAKFRNLAYAGGQILGLSKNGVTTIGDPAQEMMLTTYKGKRYFSKFVGPGSSGDYRYSSIFSTADWGHLISITGTFFLYSVKHKTWITSGLNLEMVGTLKNSNGGTILITQNYILESWGNVEHNGESYVAVAAGSVPLEPQDSTMIRSITTSADNVGHAQGMYIGGQDKSATTPPPSRAANIIGTSTWSTTNTYMAPEIRSRRHHCVLRTDEATLEIMSEEAQSNIGNFDIMAKPVGPRRPSN